MTIEDLELGKWYTIGGGDSNLKCIYIADNYAVFLSVSESHYIVCTEFMCREEIEEWGDQMHEQDAEYLEESINVAIVPKYKDKFYENFATYRDSD